MFWLVIVSPIFDILLEIGTSWPSGVVAGVDYVIHVGANRNSGALAETQSFQQRPALLPFFDVCCRIPQYREVRVDFKPSFTVVSV